MISETSINQPCAMEILPTWYREAFVMRSSVIERLMDRGPQVALKHVIHDMETRTLVMELRRRAIKRWIPCGDMDRRLKIPYSAKADCGFRTTPENAYTIAVQSGHQYRAS